MADAVLVDKTLKAGVQAVVEVGRKIGVIISKIACHLFQRQGVGVILLHIVDNFGGKVGIHIRHGARLQKALFQRCTADQVKPGQLLAAVAARPEQLHQGRSFHAEHRGDKLPLAQLRNKFWHPVGRKHP